jgi:hypothetical protein
MPQSDSRRFSLTRNAFGRLVFAAGGELHEGVVPVRAFPLTDPGEGLALVGTDGRELAWVDRLAELPVEQRRLIEEELANREFMPEILRIAGVSSFATPSTWQVVTDRGDTELVLKGEEDIRRLGRAALVVADSNGLHYLIRDAQALDKASRRILDRFL